MDDDDDDNNIINNNDNARYAFKPISIICLQSGQLTTFIAIAFKKCKRKYNEF